MNRPHDDYSILVTLKADGSVEKQLSVLLWSPVSSIRKMRASMAD